MTDREAGDVLMKFVGQAVDGLENHLTAAQLAALLRLDRYADAQLMALQAIYHELRHGHDHAARQVEVTEEHTRALHEHADAMDKLRGALLDHADALSRYRLRE